MFKLPHMKKLDTNLSRLMPEKQNMPTEQSRKQLRKPTVPKLPKRTKKLTLKAFELAYKAHHPKSS